MESRGCKHWWSPNNTKKWANCLHKFRFFCVHFCKGYRKNEFDFISLFFTLVQWYNVSFNDTKQQNHITEALVSLVCVTEMFDVCQMYWKMKEYLQSVEHFLDTTWFNTILCAGNGVLLLSNNFRMRPWVRLATRPGYTPPLPNSIRDMLQQPHDPIRVKE